MNNNKHPCRPWTNEQIEDDKLRSFMIRNRKEILAVLERAHKERPDKITEKLWNEYNPKPVKITAGHTTWAMNA